MSYPAQIDKIKVTVVNIKVQLVNGTQKYLMLEKNIAVKYGIEMKNRQINLMI